MSDETRALEDRGQDLWAWEQNERRMIEQGKWVQKNGQIIRIKKMADQHLKNTIRLIKRNMEIYEQTGQDEVRREQLIILQSELDRRNSK